MSKKFVCTDTEPIVQTPLGKLRGFIMEDVYTFHGVKYANARRWHMPEPVGPWNGVKDALNYGPVCPILGDPIPSSEVFITHRFWPQNEDCQYLNIWTKTVDELAKQPVMVWFHGGGFVDGSSIEQAAFDGHNLAADQGVVVVTINHRLNILGHLDMSSFGDEYRNSANVGIGDLVAALKWVKQNISAFGGDADNVTIFGQSGGGAKVCTLLQTPAAQGLFHKGIMMSGGAHNMDHGSTDHRPVIVEMMNILGIGHHETDKFEKVPYTALAQAYNAAVDKVGVRLALCPMEGDWYLGHPAEVGFIDSAKTIPLIVGSMIGESAYGRQLLPDSALLTDEEKLAALSTRYGACAEAVAHGMKKAYPDLDITDAVKIDTWARPGVIKFMQLHAEQCSAPGYCYMQTLKFPLFGGTLSWHCADIPFVFRNIDKVPCYGIGETADRLQNQISRAFASFARTGNPNHCGMPQWQEYTAEAEATMIFDEETSCRIGHDRELLDALIAGGGVVAPFMTHKKSENEKGKTREWAY